MRRPARRDERAGCAAAALAYAARGWSPIPVEPRGKRPLVPWLVYQRRVAGDDEIAAWFARWRRLVREGVVEGERNNTLASLTGHLLWHGVDPEVALELLLAWNRARCRPPLPDDEVARVVASIARLHERQAGADQ